MENKPSTAASRNRIRLGERWIDPDANEIDGKRIESKAMDVLMALVVVAPQVVSVARLLEDVWAKVVVGDNVVHQAIAQVRKALGDKTRAPSYIESVPRRGYRVIARVERREPMDVESDGAPREHMQNAVLAANRISIAFDSASPDHPSISEFVRAVARYVSWTGGVFRAIAFTGSHRNAGAIDSFGYVANLTLATEQGLIEVSWQLRTARSAEIIWANKHSEPTDEFLRKRDRIAEMIGEGVLRSISDIEVRRMSTQSKESFSYAQLILKARQFDGMDKDRIAQRCELLARAIALEPGTGLAHAILADVLSWKVMNDVGTDAEADAATARREAERAFEEDPNDAAVLGSVGQTYCRLGRYEEGLALIRRSCALAPSVGAKDELAMALCFAGQPREAIQLFEEILATMPAGYTFRYGRIAVALVQDGRFEEALHYANQQVLHFPTDYYGWLVLANLSAQLDRPLDGRRAIAETMKILPKLQLQRVIANTEATYGRTDVQRARLTGGLRKLMADQF